jgi:hypothetical protein
MKATLLGLTALFVAACGGGTSSSIGLDQPVALTVAGPATGSVRLHLDGASAVPSGPVISSVHDAVAGANDVAFAPDRLALALRTHDNGTGVVSDLALPLGDVRVHAPALPAAGWMLRDLVLVIRAPQKLTIARATPTLLSLAGSATLALDWQLELDDGTLYPLGPLTIGPLELHVAVTEDEVTGGRTLQLMALCPGSCGGVPDLFTISDGVIELRSNSVE